MKMYRKRFIPNEIIDISSDEVLERNENIIVTRWKPIKPRQDIGGGISYTFLKRGYKISKIFDNNGEFIFREGRVFNMMINNVRDTKMLI